MNIKPPFFLLLSIPAILISISSCGGKKAPQQKHGLAKNESKFLGNMISREIPTDFTEYWNQITIENHSKWGSVESFRGTMVWDFVDEVYQYSTNNNLPIIQHSFVWGGQQPAWISNLNETDQLMELSEFMQTYCERYPQTHFIRVVNEPIHSPPPYKNALGGDGQNGWDWVITSFQKARELCPLQGLILSDYYVIQDADVRSDYLEIVNLLNSRNLIDGIGVHATRLNNPEISAQEMQNALDELAETGLPIYMTEMYIQNIDLDEQKTKYEELFPIVWEHPSVQGVTLWGYENGKTFEESDLMDENDSPNPALQWLQRYFEQRQ